MIILVIDCETTGLPRRNNAYPSQYWMFDTSRLLEFAYIMYDTTTNVKLSTYSNLICPDKLIDRINGFSLRSTPEDLVFGKLTSIPCCIIGAVTIKIMRSTSITSTRGVTLISEIAPFFLPVLKAIINPYSTIERSTTFKKSCPKVSMSKFIFSL